MIDIVRLCLLGPWLLLLGPDCAWSNQLLKVDLQLVQAVDASGSVEPDEWALELNGIAAAFRAADVLAAIKAGPTGRIAVDLMAWADSTIQQDDSGWFVIDSSESAERFARVVETFPRRVEGGTGIGSAIAEAIRLMHYSDFDGARQIVDVSGDGQETKSREEATILLPSGIAMADAFGVTVNGLAITVREHDLADYYRAHVVTGPAHFVLTANTYADYHRAIHAKLLRELSPSVAGLVPGYPESGSGPKWFAPDVPLRAPSSMTIQTAASKPTTAAPASN
jgi:Protein of unknown function (DUF1194)